MQRYPSIWARLMGVFSAQRTHQRPDDEADMPDTEDLLSRASEQSLAADKPEADKASNRE